MQHLVSLPKQTIDALSSTEIFLKALRSNAFKNISGF